jgi:pimeloyl-ACP methyl ester carboxylesterase
MERAAVNGIELEYEAVGGGEPLLMIHGAAVAETFVPLAREPALRAYRAIRLHRRGYAGSAHPGTVTRLAEQASDAVALLRHLGVARAHVVGHSYGGLVALRLALDHPERVHTLALIEPPLLLSPFAQGFVESLRPVLETYHRGDRRGAAERFAVAVGGPKALATIERTLPPGAFDQAVRDLDTLFGCEFAEPDATLVREEEAPGIGAPVLSIVGEETGPVFRDSHQRLMQILPRVEALHVQGAAHFVQVEAPRAVAEGIAAFLARHRMGTAASP